MQVTGFPEHSMSISLFMQKLETGQNMHMPAKLLESVLQCGGTSIVDTIVGSAPSASVIP